MSFCKQLTGGQKNLSPLTKKNLSVVLLVNETATEREAWALQPKI